jgi:hypothetical protein
MGWIIACLCGNMYTAPPGCCDACGSTLDHATRPTASAADVHAPAARVVIDADPRPVTAHCLNAEPAPA